MTAPRPFAEVVEELRRLHAHHSFGVVTFERKDAERGVALVKVWRALPLLLSRLASREAVFEAAVAYLSDAHDCNDDEPCPHYDALSAAIAAARALDAATPQGEEG